MLNGSLPLIRDRNLTDRSRPRNRQSATPNVGHSDQIRRFLKAGIRCRRRWRAPVTCWIAGPPAPPYAHPSPRSCWLEYARLDRRGPLSATRSILSSELKPNWRPPCRRTHKRIRMPIRSPLLVKMITEKSVDYAFLQVEFINGIFRDRERDT